MFGWLPDDPDDYVARGVHLRLEAGEVQSGNRGWIPRAYVLQYDLHDRPLSLFACGDDMVVIRPAQTIPSAPSD